MFQVRCRMEALLGTYERAAREQTTNVLAPRNDDRHPGRALMVWRAPRFSSTGALEFGHPWEGWVPELSMRGVLGALPVGGAPGRI